MGIAIFLFVLSALPITISLFALDISSDDLLETKKLKIICFTIITVMSGVVFPIVAGILYEIFKN